MSSAQSRPEALVLIAVLVAASFSSPPASATPYRSFHVRTVLLGADSSSYYTLTTERSNHGSYYELDDSVFVSRMSLSGLMVDRRLLRAISRRDTSTSGRWVVRENAPPFDLQSYLAAHAVEPAMPSSRLAPCFLVLDSLGLSLAFERNRELLVPRQMLGVEVEEGGMQLLDYFVQSGHLLVLMRAGDPEYEGEYREGVLAIPWTRIDAAMNRVWRE